MTEKVVVIGGGFTGLVAARALAARPEKFDVTVLESGSRLGGLAAGVPLCGTNLEQAYHYLLTGDEDILTLIEELGLTDSVTFGTSSVGVYYGDRIYPFTNALDLLRFSPCTLLERFRLGLAMLWLQRMRDWRQLAGRTARDWLESACGPGAMHVVWNPLLRGKFDRHWDKVSMAWLWAGIDTRANSRGRGRERIGYPCGGFVTIIQALTKELLDAGASLRTDSRVARIDHGADRQLVLTDGEMIAFDRCLFTGPCDAFARLLPNDSSLDWYRRQLESITYLGAICVVLVSDQELGDHLWVNIHDADAPFLVLINHTSLVGTESYQGNHVYYLGCYRHHDSPWFGMEDEMLLAEWLEYLGLILPTFDRAQLRESHVYRFRNAQHVVDCDYASRIPKFRTPLDGVYLANFAQIFPHDRGTNFAVRDELKVADMIIADADQTARKNGS